MLKQIRYRLHSKLLKLLLNKNQTEFNYKIGKQIDEQMFKYDQMKIWTDEQINKWKYEQMKIWTNENMKKWKYEQMKI